MFAGISRLLRKSGLQPFLRAGSSAAAVEKARERLVDCRQGEKVVGTFSREEMQNRVDKLRAMMKEQKLEACVFTSYHNVNYYSDFLYCAFGRPYGLVVTEEDHTVIAASKFLDFDCTFYMQLLCDAPDAERNISDNCFMCVCCCLFLPHCGVPY